VTADAGEDLVNQQGKTDRTLGVVIPTIGERPELKRLLLTVLDQTRPVQAIRIVVDAHDTTLVDSIVEELSDRLLSTDLLVTSTGAQRGEGEYLVETGYGYAVNRGLETLHTDLVAFLDDDDEIRPAHFAQLEAALDPEHGVAYSQVEIVNPEGERRLFPEGDMPQGKIRTGVLIDRHPVLLPATLISRSVLDEVVGLDQTLDRLADTDMIVRLGLATDFAPVDEPTYVYYRISRKSVVNERVIIETVQMLKKHQKHMGRKERLLFWDTQARQALRAGFPEVGREAAEQVVAAIWPHPPAFLVGLYVAIRRQQTPEPLKRLARRIGPKSGQTV
jgi:glycosyltransferase involved in cell wall biosynthesis